MKKSRLLICAFLALLTFSGISMGQAGGDIKRHTIAITYLKDPVEVTMAGTTLRANATGIARVERWRKRNESEIDLKVENLNPAYNYGADYTTYVLWAITPEGQVSNLGEFKVTPDGKARLKAATPFQTFALIVTAEPHYLVRLPSRKVILENLAPSSKNVEIHWSEVYFNGDPGKYYTDTMIPVVAGRDFDKTPMELLQARRAVQIAKLANGERFDPTDFSSATSALENAEQAFRHGQTPNEVGRIARDAISFAVRTRDISEEKAIAAARRAEIERRDDDLRRATTNASDLESRLSDVETRLKASELSRADISEQLSRASREAADARAENRGLQSENDRLKSEYERARGDNDRMSRELAETRNQVANLQSQLSSQSGRVSELTGRVEAETRKRDFADLQNSLSHIVTVTPSGDGFTVVLPDSFFVLNRADLALKVKAKMDGLAQTIAAHRGVTFSIIGHSDVRPTADDFARGRAQSVADYLAGLGVPRGSFRVDSRGADQPLSHGRTLQAKATNRRVELVFSEPSTTARDSRN